MKFVLIDGFYLGKGRGVGNYIQNLVLKISEASVRDMRITVVCTRDFTDQFPHKDHLRFLKLPRLPFPLWENVLIPLVSFLLRPDIIHFPSNTSPLMPVFGRRLVTIHDTIFLLSKEIVPYSSVLRQIIGRIYLAINVRLLCQYYHRILTVSEHSKRDIQTVLKVSPERIIVSYEGPGLVFQTPKSSLESRKSILHFASQDPRKNTKRVIDAFLSSQAVRSGFILHLIGSTDKIVEIPIALRNSVKVHKFLSLSQLQELIDNTFLFLYPSLYEGFGMPIVEFQRIGIPVITSNTSACAEVGARMGSIHINPKNIFEIVRAIDDLCFDSSLALSVSANGLVNAQRFQWDKCARDVLSEYVTS